MINFLLNIFYGFIWKSWKLMKDHDLLFYCGIFFTRCGHYRSPKISALSILFSMALTKYIESCVLCWSINSIAFHMSCFSATPASQRLPNEFFAVGSRVWNQSFCMINCLIMANLIYITELPIQEVFACLHYLWSNWHSYLFSYIAMQHHQTDIWLM